MDRRELCESWSMSGAQFDVLREMTQNYDEGLKWIVERMAARIEEYKEILIDPTLSHSLESDAQIRGAISFAKETIEMLMSVESEIREVKENG